jgi:hypothetical protein
MLIEHDYSIRVQGFCHHSCRKQAVNAAYVTCKRSVLNSKAAHSLFVTRMTSAQRWYLRCGKSSASVGVFPCPEMLASRSLMNNPG